MTAVITAPPPPTVETAVAAGDEGCPKCGNVDYIGIEIRGVYDGVLFWACEVCGWAWPRPIFEGFRAEAAKREAELWRERIL